MESGFNVSSTLADSSQLWDFEVIKLEIIRMANKNPVLRKSKKDKPKINWRSAGGMDKFLTTEGGELILTRHLIADKFVRKGDGSIGRSAWGYEIRDAEDNVLISHSPTPDDGATRGVVSEARKAFEEAFTERGKPRFDQQQAEDMLKALYGQLVENETLQKRLEDSIGDIEKKIASLG